MISTIETDQGETVGISIVEITSIPSIKILPKPSGLTVNESIETVFKNDFARLLGEIHHVAFHMVPGETGIGDASFEITWVTTPVERQLYSANIKLFVVSRMISKNMMETKSNLNAIERSLKTLLKNQTYDYKDISYGEYQKIIHLDAGVCRALTRHERMELTSVPNVPCVYSYERVPESRLDLSGLACALAYCPNSVVHIQLIPTVFNLYEIQYINNFVHNATFASKGIMTQGGQVSFTQIDRPLETFKYYEYQNNGPLYEYNLVIRGPQETIGSISSQIFGQLSSDPRVPVRFDEVDVPQTCFENQSVIFMPWLVSDFFKSRINSTSLVIGQFKIDNTVRRLPRIMSAVELSEICRLPIGSDLLHMGMNVNDSKKSRTVYRDNLINSGDILLGHLKSSYEDMIGISLKDLTKHMFVAGTPGSGKSSFSVGVLDRLWRDHHIPFLVIEPAKTEYRSLIKSIPELQVFTPGKDQISPFVFNPFKPPKKVKLGSYKSTLKTAFSAAVSMTSPLDKIFEETINNAYSDHRWLDTYDSDDGGKDFNITEFIKCFKETFKAIGYVGDSSNIGRAGIVRLKGLTNLFDNYFSIPIDDLLSKPTVIELAAIENAEQKSLMISLILLSVLSYINANYSGDGSLKNVILLEEAHVLLDQSGGGSGDADPTPLAQSLVKRILAEARSYGVGMMIADQSPRKVGLDIVALTDIKVIFRIVEGNDKQIIGDSMGMDESQMLRLPKLRPGGAFLFFNKLDSPEEVVIDDYRADGRIPVWTGDEEIAKLVTYWNNNAIHLRPYPECDLPVFCKETCDLTRRILAKDVARRIFTKYVGEKADIEKLKYASAHLIPLVKNELNHEEYSKELYYCVKVHFWRHVLYESDFKISKEKINEYISR
ncbi:ATP-binding protein [Methanomethylophilus alvi]|uniref:ATP-binding protein n=1 Tax=Methanomethylophilus alvi TaxID=1291540 RepID=UPI0037DCB93C